MSANYPSDLTDGQWQLVRKLICKPAKLGRRPTDRRWVINAILYVNRTGCQWCALPHDFPKWKTVYTIFWRCAKRVFGNGSTKPFAGWWQSGRQETDSLAI